MSLNTVVLKKLFEELLKDHPNKDLIIAALEYKKDNTEQIIKSLPVTDACKAELKQTINKHIRCYFCNNISLDLKTYDKHPSISACSICYTNRYDLDNFNIKHFHDKCVQCKRSVHIFVKNEYDVLICTQCNKDYDYIIFNKLFEHKTINEDKLKKLIIKNYPVCYRSILYGKPSGMYYKSVEPLSKFRSYMTYKTEHLPFDEQLSVFRCCNN